MKKPFLFIVTILFVLTFIGVYLYSPMKIKNIELKFDKNLWGGEITDAISGVIDLNSTINDKKIQQIEKFTNSLPWVKKTDISFIKGTVGININEEPVKLCISSKDRLYNIGENGYILGTKNKLCSKRNTFFYKGKSEFFTIGEKGFPKIKNNIFLEIEIVTDYLQKQTIIDEKPTILLTDTGIKLLYSKHKIIVFLGNGGNSWQNFEKLFRILDKPYPGYYDLRFSGLLVQTGEKR